MEKPVLSLLTQHWFESYRSTNSPSWFLLHRSAHGPHIPACLSAVILRVQKEGLEPELPEYLLASEAALPLVGSEGASSSAAPNEASTSSRWESIFMKRSSSWSQARSSSGVNSDKACCLRSHVTNISEDDSWCLHWLMPDQINTHEG